MKPLKLFATISFLLNSYSLLSQNLEVSNSIRPVRRSTNISFVEPLDKVPSADSAVKKINLGMVDYTVIDSNLTGVIKNYNDLNYSIQANISRFNQRKREMTTQIESLKKNEKNKAKIQSLLDIIKADSLQIDSLKNKLVLINDDLKKAKTTNSSLDLKRLELQMELCKKIIDPYEGELRQYNEQIDKNSQSSAFNDKTLINFSNAEKQHFVDSLYNDIALNSRVQSLNLSKDVKPFLDSMKAYLDSMKERRSDIDKYKDKTEEILAVMNGHVKKFEEFEKSFTEKKALFKKEYDNYVNKANDQIRKINDEIAKLKQESAEEEGALSEFSTLAGLNQILGDQSMLTPSISIVGGKKFKGDSLSSFFGEVKLFVGAANTNKNVGSINQLFVPEASTFGFMTDFAFGFIPSQHAPRFNKDLGHYDQKLGITFGAYFLGKKLQPDSLHTVNTSLFHLRLGLQYILIPHVLNIYLNTNGLILGTGNTDFKTYYNTDKKFKSFASFGLQSYLDVSKNNDFHIFLDLGFVTTGGDVKELVNSGDAVIPNIKLSLVKTFNF